jgi:hypothetical protein
MIEADYVCSTAGRAGRGVVHLGKGTIGQSRDRVSGPRYGYRDLLHGATDGYTDAIAW